MLEITQTVLHEPEKGRHGNCFSACLASLLHIDIETVPVFCNPETWIDELQAWLKPYGFCYMESWPDIAQDWRTAGLHGTCCGPTNRFAGTVQHSCVAVDGKIVWDPHPDRSGLTEAASVGFLVALEPWKLSSLAVKHD